MVDITKHTKAQLGKILEEKEDEMEKMAQANLQKASYIKALEESIIEKDLHMHDMQDTIDGKAERTPLPIVETAESIIWKILTLPIEEQETLPQLIRTTPLGIDAYSCFIYGHANSHGGENTDGGNDDTGGGSDDGRSKNQGER